MTVVGCHGRIVEGLPRAGISSLLTGAGELPRLMVDWLVMAMGWTFVGKNGHFVIFLLWLHDHLTMVRMEWLPIHLDCFGSQV